MYAVGHRACMGTAPVMLDRHVQACLVCTDRCLYQVAKFQITEATAATAALFGINSTVSYVCPGAVQLIRGCTK